MVMVSGVTLGLAALVIWVIWLLSAQLASWAGSPRFYALVAAPISFLLAYMVIVYGPQVI